MKSGVMIIQMS